MAAMVMPDSASGAPILANTASSVGYSDLASNTILASHASNSPAMTAAILAGGTAANTSSFPPTTSGKK